MTIIRVFALSIIMAGCVFDSSGITSFKAEDAGPGTDGMVTDGMVTDGMVTDGLTEEGGTEDEAECGNGILEVGEECDGSDLGGKTCSDFEGMDSGTLVCGEDCTFDFTHCVGCGNGVREGTEECDGDDLDGETCVSLGFDGGQLGCDDRCRFDVSGCHSCGDGVREGPEECDGDDLGGVGCTDVGYDSGYLACAEDCRFDTSDCAICGDGHCHPSEENGVCIQDCSIALFEEDFENEESWPGEWIAWDDNPSNGFHYWGRDDSRSHSGSHSLWCVKGGEGPDGPDLFGNYSYHNHMDAYAVHPLDLSGVSGNVIVSFWVWCRVVSLSGDWFAFVYSGDGGENYVQGDRYYGSGSWVYMEVDVSHQAGNPDFVFGFLFHSNWTGSWEPGAFVDDIRVLNWW